jgi:YD repeat-containing protein
VSKTFAFKHQEYTIGAEKLIKETENTYYPDETKTSVVKELTYEPTYLFPEEEKITGSDGSVMKKTFKYPHQFAQTPYSTMVGKNILTPVIEQTAYEGTDFLQKTITSYRDWGNNCFAPDVVFMHSKNQPDVESRLVYHRYDASGNPVSVSKDNAEKIVCLWGYNYQYPIAEIKNATYEQVRDALGGETVVNQLSGKIIPSAADYVALNNLRGALPSAKVTVYVYKPLVGLISSTDYRGITTQYDYDPFNRLKTIYIMNGTNREILESYEYKYAN